MSAVLRLPACLCVSTAASRGQAPPLERVTATHSPTPRGVKNFGSRDFSLVPLAQGYRCLVAVFLPFHRAISLFLAHRAGQSCQSKSTLGCQKLNPLCCGVWSPALFFGSKTTNGHPNQRFWGNLSWVGGDIRKHPPPQPMISIIRSCIFESPIVLSEISSDLQSTP